MIGIGVATAAAGTVVGVVTLTGIGLVMTDFVEFISGGNLMLMLIFTAVISNSGYGLTNDRQLHRGFHLDGSSHCHSRR